MGNYPPIHPSGKWRKNGKADQLARLITFISHLPMREFLLSPLFGEAPRQESGLIAMRLRVHLSNKLDELGTI